MFTSRRDSSTTIRLNGKTVAEDFALPTGRVAVRHEAVLDVGQSAIEIELVSRAGVPQMAAIEIRRVKVARTRR